MHQEWNATLNISAASSDPCSRADGSRYGWGECTGILDRQTNRGGPALSTLRYVVVIRLRISFPIPRSTRTPNSQLCSIGPPLSLIGYRVFFSCRRTDHGLSSWHWRPSSCSESCSEFTDEDGDGNTTKTMPRACKRNSTTEGSSVMLSALEGSTTVTKAL